MRSIGPVLSGSFWAVQTVDGGLEHRRLLKTKGNAGNDKMRIDICFEMDVGKACVFKSQIGVVRGERNMGKPVFCQKSEVLVKLPCYANTAFDPYRDTVWMIGE